MGDGIVVQIEASIRGLADGNGNLGRPCKRIIWQRQEERLFKREGFSDGDVETGAPSVGGDTLAPGVSLGIEIVEVAEAAGGKEVVADIANGPLDAALLIAPGNGHWTGIITMMGGKGEQRGVEADRLAMTLEHGAFEIVVQNGLWNPAPPLERLDMTGQKRLHPGIEEETQEDPPGLAEHDDEGHERPSCPADLHLAEVTPVRLGLFAGKRAQTQIRFGFRTGPMTGDHVPEVAAVTAVSPFLDHAVKSGGGQGWERLQGLQDERKIGVDLACAAPRAVGHQTRAGQHGMNGVMVDAELAGNGVRPPLLDVVIAQDLRLQFNRDVIVIL